MEVLIVKKVNDKVKVVCVQNLNQSINFDDCFSLNASFQTLIRVKYELSYGNDVYISKRDSSINEIVPEDLEIIENTDPLQAAKNLAINDINNKINQNIFQTSVIDSMDYLDSMMKLISNGIFITDENREDKYFEIIEKSQTVEEPTPLDASSSFEDEQKYIELKREYDNAQSNLQTLEKYLNAYDKLSKIRFVNNMLSSYKDRVMESKNVEEIEVIIREYYEKIEQFFFSKPCSI